MPKIVEIINKDGSLQFVNKSRLKKPLKPGGEGGQDLAILLQRRKENRELYHPPFDMRVGGRGQGLSTLPTLLGS